MAQHKRHPRDPARQTPLEQARAWWGSQVKAARYVVRPGDAPSRAVARVLRQEGLVLEAAGGRVWVLVPPGAVDHHAVFLANYWPIVALVLEAFEIRPNREELCGDVLVERRLQLVELSSVGEARSPSTAAHRPLPSPRPSRPARTSMRPTRRS